MNAPEKPGTGAIAAQRRPPARVRFGLGGRLFTLVIAFVMLTEVVVYVPSIANFHNTWLRNRLSAANTAALVFAAAPADMVPADLADAILTSVGAHTIVLKTADTRRLLAASEMPRRIDDTFDLRTATPMDSIIAAFRTLFAPDGRILNLVGDAPMGARFLELTLDETPLRMAMIAYSVNILLLSLIISGVVAALAFFALHRMVLRPVRRLTSSIVAFGDEPENATLIISPSGSQHEIGVAEDALATMQSSLVRELNRSKHLAALGLAVAKINHDLRNILASAQLLSDRLAELSDPLGRSLAPRLVATLDRAIAYCQSTLNYGKAAEPAPQFARVVLRPLAQEAASTAITASGKVEIHNEIPDDLAIRADAEQMFRVFLNILRNAVDALETAGPRTDTGAVVRLRARRERDRVAIEIGDSGPGVPERARARLFEAFQGSARPGGVGLGLAIAADLVRANGGELSLSDTPDAELGGALFRIAAPIANGERNSRPG